MKEIFPMQKGSGMLHPIQHPARSAYYLLFHTYFNIFAAESRAVLEDLIDTMRAKLCLVVLFIDLPECGLCKGCNALRIGVLRPLHFDQNTGQVICLRYELDIKTPFARFPV